MTIEPTSATERLFTEALGLGVGSGVVGVIVLSVLAFAGRQLVQTWSKAALDAAKHKMSEDILRTKKKLDALLAKEERMRAERYAWQNSVYESVRSLSRRLGNILTDDGHVALAPGAVLDPQWSMTHEYFLESTMFLFAQYFCCVQLIRDDLSFELFASIEERDRFFSAFDRVSNALGTFPRSDATTDAVDRQVFRLEQREIGETLIVSDKRRGRRCMRFATFRDSFSAGQLDDVLLPLRRFLVGLEKEKDIRFRRLEDVKAGLEQVEQACVVALTGLVEVSAASSPRQAPHITSPPNLPIGSIMPVLGLTLRRTGQHSFADSRGGPGEGRGDRASRND